MAVGSLPAPDPSAGGVCGSHNGSDLRIAIVTARWNDHLTGRLLDGARRAYDHCSIPHEAVTEVWAPGSFELPLVCQQLAGSGEFDAVIAIGVVVRGETTHYDIVSEAAAVGVREAASSTGVPVIFGVLTTENEDQVLARAGDDDTNKGFEAVVTAVEMATLLRKLPGA
ncbi:MAG: 6,7-dimethyl-8-ribityllumazine synthase [Acidimicrobiaceae bacterium]|jgi:6,7-dimethyl-8-ribityllumazine synthase|nr:6,7-dimethyl-8-ribityllumazine synthase [Acidimicrobiaceae bacterium]MBT6446133.1 6,7-dimethyl-8-ribityllumazine synthase [Acidimicrobiaceae bacterium]